MLPATAPVPAAKDTGKKYTTHPISSGPYMWDGDVDVNTGGTLVRNPNWDAATDPNRAALPDQIDVKLGLQADDLDNQIISGDQDVDIAGTGVQPAALPKVLQDEELQARADNPVAARLWFTQIIGTVKPLDNIECRKAIMYAMSPASYQNAYGGEFAGGELASTILPPTIPGYSEFDIYGQKDNPDGQPDKAKEALKKCGQPDGFETSIGYRSSREKEKATAVAFQEALGKVGIKVNVKPLADDTFTSATCGKPSYVVANNMGLCVYGWGADWNTGYGFLSQIVDSRVINPEGGSANFAVRDPGGRQDDRRALRGAGRGQACRDLRPDRQEGHGGCLHLPGHLRQGRAAALGERDELLHQRRVRLLRLHRAGCEAVVASRSLPHRR